MKSCVGCKYAEWDLTKSGKLHPKGGGLCNYEIIIPKLPANRFYYTYPQISTARINRKEQLKEDCIYYQRKPQQD